MVRPLMRAKGWSNVVWSGADPVLMRNLWFIAVSRRAHFLHSKLRDELEPLVHPEMTLAQTELAAIGGSSQLRV